MAVFTPSYPLTFPTVSGIKTQRFALTRTVAVSASPFTGQEQVFQHEGEIWSTQITFPPMLKDKAAVVLAFLLQLRGRRGTFKIGDQDRKTIQGVATGTIRITGLPFTHLISANGRAVSNNLFTSNWTGNNSPTQVLIKIIQHI